MKAIEDLEARVSRFASAMTLLTDTTEAGLSTVAGAPFLVKEIQAAKGDLALGVGLMFLMMIVTIVYVPLVLPRLLSGVEVDAWAIDFLDRVRRDVVPTLS